MIIPIAPNQLYALVSELQILVNGKLDKIYQPEKTELLLQFHVPNFGKRMLRIVAGKYMYLTDFRLPGDKPPGFCVQLRKLLTNARLRTIEQKGFERVVEFVFEQKKDEFISLIVELFGKGNILLVKSKTIVLALMPKIWKDRTLKIGEEYICPKKEYNLLDFKADSLRAMLQETDKESVVKALAMDLGLGGMYAEDILADAGISKDKSPRDVKDIEGLFKAIERLKKQKPKGFVYATEIVPYELLQYKSVKHQEFSTFNEAINDVFSSQQKKDVATKETEGYDKEVERISLIIKNQKNTLVSLQEKENDAREKAELIYSNYQTVKELLQQINDAINKHGWDKVKERLKGHNIIKDLNPKDKTLVVEL
ncbi:NFACT family protein [Candidatus Woesearchaeota archaeon]|nr:NFACT family protein [Candidatus Woesearchaeota archaeon]